MEDKRKELEEKFQNALKTAQKLAKEIGEMRAIELPPANPEDKEQFNEIFRMTQDIEGRTNYLLRGLLVPFGGSLFL